MRVTNNMLTKGYLNNLSRNLGSLQKIQEQMTTGKAIQRASDNPILVSKIMMIKDNIIENEHYNGTINDSLAWTQTQDSALDGAAKSMRRIRDLVISAAKDTLSDTDRVAIRDEIKSEVESLSDVFNTNFDGRYIFAGKRTSEKPFELDDEGYIKYTANEDGKNSGNIEREISKGVSIELVTDGSRLVEADGANEDIGQLLGDLLKDVVKGDKESVEKLSGEYLDELDKHMDNLIQVRTQIGAIDNRLEAAKTRNEGENLNLKSILSNKEDVDVVEKYMESVIMSTVYQASLSAGAKILQPSLLDYIR